MPRALIIRLTISLFFYMVIRIKIKHTIEDRFSILESQENRFRSIFFYSKGMEEFEIDIPKFIKPSELS